MYSLPAMTTLTSELVRQQFDEPSRQELDSYAAPSRPVRKTRIALAAGLDWAARVVHPDRDRFIALPS